MRSTVFGLALLMALPAAGQVQLTIRGDGKKVISNIGVGSGRSSNFVWLAKQRNKKSKYDRTIERYSEQFAVDPILVRAVIQVESSFDPMCVSHRGARGLMQLMPETAQALRLEGDDPAANVLAGARYLRQLLDRFGSVELALAAYNAGPTAVERSGAAPTLGTLRYVKNVEARAGRLLACAG